MRKKTKEQTTLQEQQPKTDFAKDVLTVGVLLKKTREEKGEKIEKIANALRIRPVYLKALEESDYQVFPGQAYALGFLRSYALFLGLDADELMTQYRKETSFIKPDELNMPITEQPTLFPSAKCLLVSVAAIVIVWAFWYFLTYKETQIENPEPVVTVQETIVPEDVIIVNEENIEPVESKEAEKTKEVAASKAKQTKKSTVQIVAREEVWVEIEQDDTLILSRSLKKNEKYDVPESKEELFLKTGNAGGLDIFVDGKKVKPLGPVGRVVRGVSLSPEKLKKR